MTTENPNLDNLDNIVKSLKMVRELEEQQKAKAAEEQVRKEARQESWRAGVYARNEIEAKRQKIEDEGWF